MYSYHAGYHVRIGIDRYLNNMGNEYFSRALGNHSGIEKEQCDMLMKLLKWSYDYVYYENDLGNVDVDQPEKSTGRRLSHKQTQKKHQGKVEFVGMLGDLINERIDMICARIRMTADRRRVIDFTYPTAATVKQVRMFLRLGT